MTKKPLAAAPKQRKKMPVGRPFKPGQSGNPRGRVKADRTLTTALEEIVDKAALAAKLYKMALSGNMQAIKYVYDRIEGMPLSRSEVEVYDAREQAEAIADELGLEAGSEERKAAVIEAERLMTLGLD